MATIVKDLALVLLHSTVQFGVGLSSGTVIDSLVFKPASDDVPSNGTEFFMDLVEAGAQVAANGVLSLVVLRALSSLAPEMRDPTNGVGFFIAQLESQPNLVKRVSNLSSFIQRELTGMRPTVKNVGQSVRTASMARGARMPHGTMLGAYPSYSA